MIICEYGCGQEAKYQFKNGKWCCSKNCSSCPEMRRKNGDGNRGRSHTKEAKRNMSKGQVGRIAWNKGLTKDKDERILKYAKSISKTLTGRPGKPHSAESKHNLRKHAIKNKLGGHTSKKSIYYKHKSGEIIYLHSNYEKLVAIELDKNNIRWERPNSLPWVDDNNISHRYYPDFFLTDYNIYLDPKNYYLRKKDKRKIELVQKQNKILLLVLSSENLSWKKIQAAIAQSGRADPL